MQHLLASPLSINEYKENIKYYSFTSNYKTAVDALTQLTTLVATLESIACGQDQDSLIVWEELPNIKLDTIKKTFCGSFHAMILPSFEQYFKNQMGAPK